MAYAVYGAGGFAREVAPLLRDVWLNGEAMLPSTAEGDADIVFVDDSLTRKSAINGYRVISFEDLLSPEHRARKIVVAIGDGGVRRRVEEKCLQNELEVVSALSPKSTRMDMVEMGVGSVLCEGVIITSNVTIGRSFQANLQSYVGHDCIIGDYVTFAPRVSCNGNVHIGNGVYVGTGAMIIQGTLDEPLIVGEGATIGMGSVVTKSVPPFATVVGNPARAFRTANPE